MTVRNTTPIGYSPKLDSMTGCIRAFQKNLNDEGKQRTNQAIIDFCRGYSNAFQDEFAGQCGVRNPHSTLPTVPEQTLLTDFVRHLGTFDGECVFQLRDTFRILDQYQHATGKGIGMLINRDYLCRGEEDYFTLLQLFYDALSPSQSLDVFLDGYQRGFEKLLKRDTHFEQKSREIFEYIRAHQTHNKIHWVDMGFQFTFPLFCYASAKHHSNDQMRQDFYCLSAFPWLGEAFKGKYFCNRSEWISSLEQESAEAFTVPGRFESKGAGAILGFAIGDTLGWPAAGINRKDIGKFLTGEITEFTANPKHPFFSNLGSGQYTHNTDLLMTSFASLVGNNDFDLESHVVHLVEFGKAALAGRMGNRWLGSTASKAIQRLIDGHEASASGLTTTQSCSAAYRIVPLGVHYRVFHNTTPKELIAKSEQFAMVTHNSEISKTGASIVGLLLSDLMGGVLPETAALSAVATVTATQQNRLLLERMREAIASVKTMSITEARKRFGTGSPIYQTLPLATFCFLKFQNDFESAVVAAANSYRDDTPQEVERLAGLSCGVNP